MKKHPKQMTLVVFILMLFVAMLSLTLGSTMLTFKTVIKELFGYGEGEYTFIIRTLRLPRVYLALLAGAALGISGLILQSIFRNPLASPDIIGITSGATASTVVYIALFMNTMGISGIPFAAMFGAGVVTLAIYLLAWNNGVTPIRLVLIGIGLAIASSAVTTMMIVLSPTEIATKANLWMVGSIYGAQMKDLNFLLYAVGLFTPLLMLLAKDIHVQELGDDIAKGLGARIQLQRFLFILISVLLAGFAVAYVGAIGFVGLIAPHIARQLVGRSFSILIPVSGMIGAILVCAADLIGRIIFIPYDIPAGVFTAMIGAPFFIYLLYRNRHQ